MELSFADELVWFEADETDIAYFTQGQCNALAWEIHKLTGWTLGMLSDEPVGSEDYMGHAFVIDSNGLVIDIEGRVFMNDFRDRWDYLPLIHRFFDSREYELEMTLWQNRIHYTRDRYAKQWAKTIVDILR